MNGPEHTGRAEGLIYDPSTYNNVERAGVFLATAQVHASLSALAAAAVAAMDDHLNWQQAP